MSRIYRALEKAEKEKQQQTKGESFSRIPEKEMLSKEGEPISGSVYGLEKGESFSRIPEKEMLSKEGEPISGSVYGLEEELYQLIREQSPVLLAHPSSFAAEQFRKLKTHLFLRFTTPPHFFLITSSIGGEGKTTTAMNLAIAISQEFDRKAILIQADLRKPPSDLKGQQSLRSLSNYLEGRIGISEVLTNSGNGNLLFIPAGKATVKPAEMIGSKRMEELFRSMRSFGKNTYVIIDSPPILSTSEPILLSKLVDGVILAVLAGETPKGAVRRSVEAIGREKILGFVFNQKNLKRSRTYGDYYYTYARKYPYPYLKK